ncbi:testin [Dunckerocampus dactyliophorus]|uniref:testin n=1 Tax=Dunckerocampus dactyliophorus TaxID=161453 RepID=UPI002406FDE1|nr:testin [Dunckerocampus dactyliophorus]
MEIEKEVKKMTLGHEFGAGAACLKCKDKCEGFELHFWRKICRNCKCGLTEHNVQMNSEENKKVGKLFEDTKYTGLITKLKTDGVPVYHGNAVTITLASPATAHTVLPAVASIAVPHAASSTATVTPATAAASVRPAAAFGGAASGVGQAQLAPAAVTPLKVSTATISIGSSTADVVPVTKDTPLKSVTYDWAPPVANKCVAVRYIELLPPEKRPVAGSEGAAYRRQQMAHQLPEHDQDPAKCHQLSPAEVKQMQQYVRKYKDEALGIGDVRLPEEMVLVQAAAGQVGPGGAGAAGGPKAGAVSSRVGPKGAPGAAGTGAGATSGSSSPAGGAVGTAATAGAMVAPGAQQTRPSQQNFSCRHCEQPMRMGDPAVYAERAGYDKLWHPACFVCCTCNELLVDMIYFWKRGKLYCGRHYGDSEKPRCAGCDELIFCNEYTQAEGHNWHLKHFCCFECDLILAGETYVMEQDKPVCTPCYMNNYAVKCSSCQQSVEPEAQRVSYGDYHWHAAPQCFKCSGCSKCLIGQRFMAAQACLFCSVECKKNSAA